MSLIVYKYRIQYFGTNGAPYTRAVIKKMAKRVRFSELPVEAAKEGSA